jgi:hypothetical protein
MTSPLIHPRLLISTIACLVFTTPLWAQWSRTSGPEGGYAADLLSTPQALLLGLESGGVYRSTDDGTTWQYASIGLRGLGAGGDAFAMLGTKVFVSMEGRRGLLQRTAYLRTGCMCRPLQCEVRMPSSQVPMTASTGVSTVGRPGRRRPRG